jgi:hypothetical protein
MEARRLKNRIEWFCEKRINAFSPTISPALKVRNNQYLVMIYGIDFQTNYSHNLSRRKISRKLECSINDWRLNWEMLNVKYADINKENQYLKDLVLNRIMGEEVEDKLDIRL